MEPHARLLVHTSTGYTALAYRNLCLRLLCAMQVASASAKYKKSVADIKNVFTKEGLSMHKIIIFRRTYFYQI